MRNILLVLAIVACLTVPAVSNDCATLGTWGERGVVSDYAVSANTLYAADGRGVTIYDVTNPAAIRQRFTAHTASPSRQLAISGDRLLVLTDRSLDVFAIGNGSLSFLGRADTGDTRLAVSGDTIATAGSSVHLWRLSGGDLNVSAELALDAPADALLVDGSTLYASQHDAGVATFNLAASSPTRGATIPVAAVDMAVAQNHLYAASGGAGLQVVDLADRAAPKVVATLLTGEVDLRSVATNGSTLFATDALATPRLLSFSLADPSAPAKIETLDEPARAIAVDGNRLFISGFVPGIWESTAESGAPVREFDVSQPGAMTLAGQFVDRGGPLTGAATDGHYAYVADPPLFRVISIDSPSRPTEVARVALDDFSDRVRLFGNLAVVYGITSAHLIDVSDPRNPKYLGVYHSPGGRPRNAVAMAGPYLVETNHAAGLHVLDLTDPAHPFHMTGLKNDGWGEYYGVTALPDSLYGIVQRGVKVINLSDKHHAFVSSVLQAGRIVDAQVATATDAHENLLVLIDATNLEIYSLRDPLKPALVSTLPVGESLHLALDTNAVYVMTAANELLRVDITDPPHPVVTSTATGFDAPTQTAFGGGRIVVADTYSLKILDDLAPIPVPPPVVPNVSIDGRATRRSATVTWTVPSASYDVQISPDADFTSPEQLTVKTNRVSIALDGPRWVRVRTSNPCMPGAWSEALKIDPASFARVSFADRAQRVVVRKGATTISIPVTIANSSSENVTAAVRQAASTTTQNVSVAAGANATITVQLNAAATGSITLELLDNGSVADSHVVALDVVEPQTTTDGAGDFLVIPGVAAAKGREDTNWKSDLSILCRSTSPCTPRIDFVPFNTTQRQSLTLAMQPGEVLQLPDVVRGVFGNDSASGSIELRDGDLSALVASATTYNDSPSGRYGQRIAAQRAVDGAASVHRQLLGISANNQNRTNIGLLNTSTAPQTIRLTLYTPSGAPVTREITLDPNAAIMAPVNQVLGIASIDDGWIDVAGSPAIATFASRVDQRTGDATFSYATSAGSDTAPAGAFPSYTKVFDSVSASMGEIGAVWRTAMQIVNPNDHDVDVTLTMIPGSDPSKAVAKTIHLAANAMISSDNVFSDLFRDTPPVLATLASLRVTSASPVAGWARIYNTTAAGTFGQYVPLRDASPSRIPAGVPSSAIGKMALPESERLAVMAPLAADSARRTNIGLTEVAGKEAIVQLNVYDASGSLVATKELYVPALGSLLAQRILDTLGLTGLTGMRAEVQPVSGDGVVHAYASVVENATGDAVFIPME